MYPYEHMITMECKEVCIPGKVQASVWEKNCAWICLCFADCLLTVTWCDRGKKIGKVRAGEGSERKREKQEKGEVGKEQAGVRKVKPVH